VSIIDINAMRRTITELTPLWIMPLLFLLSACTEPPPAETIILENIKAIELALEEKNRSDVMQFVADDFIGRGYINREELGKMLLLQFLTHHKITVTVVRKDIKLEPGHTDLIYMKISVIVTGATRLIPDDGRIYQVTGRWQFKGDKWLMDRLHWE